MEYAKRTDALGNWNFEQEWIEAGNALLNDANIKKAAKEVAKYLLRVIELKIEREDVLGKGYQFNIGFLINGTGGVSVHGDRKSRITFRCERCYVSCIDKLALNSSAWAIYQLALPEVLKKCKHISEYHIKLANNDILQSAGVSIDLVLA